MNVSMQILIVILLATALAVLTFAATSILS
jgi:hypothetical protein